ncbi:Hypothetical predicted protein [Xyrichtys novacula]|uniref:Uncharacterized protein n=1 Tax=Xyrichtys novacula TaxID=13765 RepID=A0AAV1HBX6_XYRNO|nr:Hypothetical predicted protein [Xyrichtys novacula]
MSEEKCKDGAKPRQDEVLQHQSSISTCHSGILMGGRVALAVSLSCPSFSSAPPAIHIPPAATRGPQRPGQGVELESCVMHLNAKQACRLVSPPRADSPPRLTPWHPNRFNTRQHLFS